MNRFIIVGKDRSEIETEIMYAVATARAGGEELVVLNYEKAEQASKVTSTASKVLKEMKRQGRIQMFVAVSDIDGASTEVRYLENKYPDFHTMIESSTLAILKL